ncbi:nuclear transport factor 2-like protein [Amycolatopsis thermoflava]
MRDYDRFASLFTADGRWCIPPVADFTGPDEIRACIERLQAHWEFFELAA